MFLYLTFFLEALVPNLHLVGLGLIFRYPSAIENGPLKKMHIHSLKLTFSPLKMDGWTTRTFPFGALNGLFSGAKSVRFRVPGISIA